MDDSRGGPRPADDLVAELRERVEARRAAGEYPPGLEDDLDAHFRRIVDHRVVVDLSDVHARLVDVEAAMRFDPARISAASGVPGGTALHRTVSRLVGRQTQGILEQVQAFADATRSLLGAVVEVLGDPRNHEHSDLVGQIDMLLERLAAFERAPADASAGMASLHERVERLEELERRRSRQPSFSRADYEAQLGVPDDPRVNERVGDRAPVFEVVCPSDVDVDVVDALAHVEDGSLGAVVAVRSLECHDPSTVVAVVETAARKLRPSGRLVVESYDPTRFDAAAWYVDPARVRPVPAAYLAFACRHAGFTDVVVEEPLDGDFYLLVAIR